MTTYQGKRGFTKVSRVEPEAVSAKKKQAKSKRKSASVDPAKAKKKKMIQSDSEESD